MEVLHIHYYQKPITRPVKFVCICIYIYIYSRTENTYCLYVCVKLIHDFKISYQVKVY